MKKLFLVLLLSTLAVHAEIEFSGFFITPKEALFTIGDPENKQVSGWLKIGQSFAGYTVISFDRENEILTLKTDGRSLQLSLRKSAVKNAKTTIKGTIIVPGGQIKGVQASMFLGEESAFPLRDDMTLYLTPSVMPDGNILYRARFVTKSADDKEAVIAVPSVVARPGEGFGIRVGEVGFSFKP